MKSVRRSSGLRGAITSLLVVACVMVVSSNALAANKLIVQDNAATPNDKFVVTDTGYVGVGTNTPVAGMHVEGATVTDALILSHFVGSTQGGGGGINLFHNNLPALNGGLPQQFDRLGSILFGSYMDPNTRKASAGIAAYSDGLWSATSTPSYVSIQTTPVGSVARVESLKIASSGNVGVGTGNPTQKVEVNGGIKLNTAVVQPTCAVGVRGTIWFTRSAVGAADKLEVCAKDASENYAWHALY